MTEYDNTNTGAVFKPFPNNEFILEGKLDIEKAQHKIVVIKGKTKDGTPIMKLYTELCCLFPNDNDNANAPQYSGNCIERFQFNDDEKVRLASWIKEKDGNKYMSLQISTGNKPKEKLENITPNIAEDSIPF